MTENKELVNGKWIEAEPLQFYYPRWIEIIPIKCVRKIAKKWYWEHGEWLEWQIEKWRADDDRK